MKLKQLLVVIVLVILGVNLMPTFAGTSVIELVDNSGFENTQTNGKPAISPWKVVNGAGDKIYCEPSTRNISVHFGRCAFMFKGGTGESTKLIQTVSAVNIETLNNTLNAGNGFIFISNFHVLSESDATRLTYKAIVTLSDNSSLSVTIPHTGNTNDATRNAMWASKPSYGTIRLTPYNNVRIKNIKIIMTNKSSAGKAYIDQVNFNVSLFPL